MDQHEFDPIVKESQDENTAIGGLGIVALTAGVIAVMFSLIVHFS